MIQKIQVDEVLYDHLKKENDYEIQRILYEIENIGDRVPMSKKKVTWSFIFNDSAQVHTIILEHSRISGKKRVQLDGKLIFKQENFISGEWKFNLQVPNYNTVFTLIIKDAKKINLVDKRTSLYSLEVQGKEWESLPERCLNVGVNGNSEKTSSNGQLSMNSHGDSKWGSDSYAQRISYAKEYINETTVHNVWIFTFGFDGDIHKLILDHIRSSKDESNNCNNVDYGEKVIILNREEICRTTKGPEIMGSNINKWYFNYNMPNGHIIQVGITKESATNTNLDYAYDLVINDKLWEMITETDYELIPNWEPVFSTSTNKVYYRNDEQSETEWKRPIQPKPQKKNELLNENNKLLIDPLHHNNDIINHNNYNIDINTDLLGIELQQIDPFKDVPPSMILDLKHVDSSTMDSTTHNLYQ